jgi:stringent starvation protein B
MTLNFADAAKARQLRDFFQKHGRIYIVVDATSDELDIPGFLKGDPALRLVLNVRMPQPIHIHDELLESDFSFSGQVYSCRIPMQFIWAAYLPEGDMDHGIVWEEDVPETIRVVVNAVRGLSEEEATEEVADESGSEEVETNATETGEGGRKVRHLRVVK